MKANNFQKAKEELLVASNKGLADTLKEEIPAGNENGINAILFKKTHNEQTKSYDDSYYIQVFSPIGFEKLKESYAQMGVDKVIVLHDSRTPKVQPNTNQNNK
jgi:hypothetical protein